MESVLKKKMTAAVGRICRKGRFYVAEEVCFRQMKAGMLVRVLDLLEPGDLRLGQVVIKRVAVVKFPMLVLLLLPA